MLRKFKKAKLIKSTILILLTILFCEYLIFLIYISKCNWSTDPNQFNLKAIALSDTHLIGLKRGHFLDKLKREWQMYICFQLAIYLFKPNSVLILGDLFDEGLIADNKQFKKYSSRFFELFPVKDSNLIVSVGNHDVGFHDRMVYYDPFFRGRFENVFNSSLIEFKILNGINVINVNSMAMKQDDCELCSLAEHLIDEISSKLFKKCANTSEQKSIKKLCEEQRPILMSHFPLFRKSDLDCDELDSNYDLNEKTNIIPNLGCLSKSSTDFLLKKLQPRLSLNGHTHYGCVKKHRIKLDNVDQTNKTDYISIDEYTLSSFNYRNRPNPSFLLLLINTNEFRISKCMIPNENYLFFIYFLVILYIFKILFIDR